MPVVLPRFANHWTWLFLLYLCSITAGTNQHEKLNQEDIAKLLGNLDRASSTLGNGGEVLGHTKPEKNEIIEDGTPGSSGTTSRDKAVHDMTTAVESGETYLTGKPIKIKIKGSHEKNSSSFFYSIKPEDDEWLKKKVEQIKNSNL